MDSHFLLFWPIIITTDLPMNCENFFQFNTFQLLSTLCYFDLLSSLQYCKLTDVQWKLFLFVLSNWCPLLCHFDLLSPLEYCTITVLQWKLFPFSTFQLLPTFVSFWPSNDKVALPTLIIPLTQDFKVWPIYIYRERREPFKVYWR